MGVFDGIENASAGYDSNYIRNGRYWARIGTVKVTQNFRREQFLAIELTVVHVLDDDEGRGHKAGEDIVHLIKAQSDMFLGNVKQFVSSALGCGPDAVDKNAAEKIVSDEQPLAGIVLNVSGREITTKQGKPFTKVTYGAEVTAEELATAGVA